MPCHHTLEAYLDAYIEGRRDWRRRQEPLFRTIQRGTGRLSTTALP